jgi:hypothetical protein
MQTPAERVEYYRERAAECERLAAQATSPENREILLSMSMRWRELAGDDVSPPQPPSAK